MADMTIKHKFTHIEQLKARIIQLT